jgi:hypothetical protein
MMNTEFADIIATGRVIIYMDDILVATRNNLEEHQQLVHQVLARLLRFAKRCPTWTVCVWMQLNDDSALVFGH